MDRSTILLVATFLVTVVLSSRTSHAEQNSFRGHVLVVFNSSNSESDTLAHYYGEKRHIPMDHILGVRTSDKEEISRDEFNDQIRDPIDAYVVSKGWIQREPGHSPFGDQQLPVLAARHNEIYIMVLMYGMPLKIANDPKINDTPVSNAALNSNAASVDSELTLLPYQGLPVTGWLPNPYQLLSYNRPFDSLDAKHMIMVTRLDGPTTDDVRRMIDDSIYAERSRLAGNVYLDARGITDDSQKYYQGDRWLRDSVKTLRAVGFHTEIDENTEVFPDSLPWTNVALYAGWFAGSATGPFMRESRTFSRGAIAYHIHDLSASTLRSATSNWCGPLISKGVAATMGAVYEPYLDYMPQWDVFIDRLLHGYTFAEASYASTKALSWMTVFVGDPLYSPFETSIDEAIASSPDKPSVRKDYLLIQRARAALINDDSGEAKNLVEKAVAGQNATFVAWEGYAEIMSDPRLEPPNSTVAKAYENAYNLSVNVEDQIRTGMEAATAYQARFRPQDSQRILHMLLSRYTNQSIYYGVDKLLKQIQNSQPSSAQQTESPSSGVDNPAVPPPTK